MRSKNTLLLSWSCVPSLVAFTLVAPPALAGDGVLEINQTCAIQTGCFSGDAAGLPVTISGSAGRSYRLTSDLVVPDENTDGIVVSIDFASIDLGGFEIRGPVTCSDSQPVTCSLTGTGSGIEKTAAVQAGVALSVRNGSIRGMGLYGVFLGAQAEVTNLRVRSNRSTGISASYGSTISGNTVHSNGGDGISAGSGSTISSNSVWGNGDEGITADIGSTVSNNAAYFSGGNGIQVSSGCTVQGNAIRLNAGFGLLLGSQAGYRENVISGNTAGTVSGAQAVNLGDNACNGTTTCP